MGFLYGIIAFFVGEFTFFQLLGAVFVALPYIKQFNGKYQRLENHFKIVIGIQLIIAAVVLIITFVYLKEYYIYILIGYFVIPSIFVYFSREAIKEETIKMMDNESPQREEIFNETKDFILDKFKEEFENDNKLVEYLENKIGKYEDNFPEEENYDEVNNQVNKSEDVDVDYLNN